MTTQRDHTTSGQREIPFADDTPGYFALWYAAGKGKSGDRLGWHVFPLHTPTAGGGCSCGNGECKSVGKHPRTPNGLEDACNDSAAILGWWQRWPDANIGLACGASGLVALDFDTAKPDFAGQDLLDRLLAEHPTTGQRTGSGGYHLLYRQPDGEALTNRRGDLPRGVDVRGHGGYIVLAPGLHRSGNRYAWAPGGGPHVTMPAPLPDFVLDLIQRAKQATPPAPTPRPMPSGGGRDDVDQARAWLARLAPWRCDDYDPDGGWVGVGMALSQLGPAGLALWEKWSSQSPKYTPGECDRKWRTFTPGAGLRLGSLKYWADQDDPGGARPAKSNRLRPSPDIYTNGDGPHQGGDDAPDFPPERYADTEMGNARRMHDRMGGKLFYVPQFQKWYTWAGTHWAEDKTFRVLDMAKQTVLSMYAELADCTDDAERKRRLAWIRQSESRNRLENMIALLRSEPGIAVLPDTLDQHPMLLPCRNGTLDLTTGQLLPPDPAHHLTQRIDIDYNPAATCPQWERFLDRIMGGNGELIGFVQRLIGHTLTGDVSGKYLVFLYGPSGNNGKSTMVETIMRLLGPFALKSPTEMVMAKGYRGGGIPNDIARLRGVRFTVTNEVDAGMTLSESIVKDLTGGDTLTARFMRAEYFDFRPSHKLWMVGNHRPEIRGTDAAIWDRVKLIPFTVEIPKAERDKQLPAKLAAELPGILRWAVDGCLAWQRDGLNAPDLVTHAVADYREEQDVLGQFIGECCDVGPAYTATAGTLYQAYEAWTKQNGGAPLSGNKFGGDMERRGYPAARVGGIRARRGVQLNAYGRGLLPAKSTFHTDDERP